MILRKLFRLSVAALLAAGSAAPALAVPNPLPRPPHLKGKALPVVPAPVAGIPAAFAPAPQTEAPVPLMPEAPVASPATETPPASIGDIAAQPAAPAAETVSTTEPATAPDTAAAPLAAPLDLTAPGAAQGAESATNVAAVDPAVSPTETQTLAKVNTYFNGIRTLVGNFTQVGPDGSKADGKFFLQKPGKVRFYYQRPSTTDIISDGKSLVVRDRKLATQDVYPLNQTPLKFLLDNNLDLARDSKVVAVYEEPGLVSVAIEEDTTFGGKARVLIVFSTEDQNFELKQWTITDPQGLDTTVALSELDTATAPDDKLFAVDYTRYKR